MIDSTNNEAATPTVENYEGRVAPDQLRRIENALIRENRNIWLSPFMVVGYLTVWQAIRLWRGHIDSQWLLLVSLNLVPVILISLLLVWVERRQHLRGPRVNRMRRELQQGTIMQSDGELTWRDHAYTPVVSGRGLFALDTTVRYLLPGPYRFFYLPETGLLIAAEPMGEAIPQRELLIALAHAQGFSTATLAANRAGEATKERAESVAINALLLAFFAGMILIVLALETFYWRGRFLLSR